MSDRHPIKRRAWSLAEVPTPPRTRARCFSHEPYTQGVYRAVLAGEAKPDVEQLILAYRPAWLPHEPDKIRFGSTETVISSRELARSIRLVRPAVRRDSTGSRRPRRSGGLVGG